MIAQIIHGWSLDSKTIFSWKTKRRKHNPLRIPIMKLNLVEESIFAIFERLDTSIGEFIFSKLS